MNLRDATVLGLVGAGGIGRAADLRHERLPVERGRRDFAGLIVLVLIIEWISAKIRVKLARG